MSLAYLFHYLMLNMFRMVIQPSSGACDLFVELFHGLYCSGTMCVGVTLWFGWGGVVSGCRLKLASACIIDVKLVSLYSTIKMMHGPVNIRGMKSAQTILWLHVITAAVGYSRCTLNKGKKWEIGFICAGGKEGRDLWTR